MTLEMNQSDPDYPALLFADTMIGEGSRSRLWLRIREKEGLSYAVQSAFVAGAVDKFSQLLAVAICNPKNILKVESAFREEMSKIVADGFSADEVATMRKAFFEERQLDRAQDPSLVRELARNAQYGWTMARDAEIERRIAALSAESITAALKRHIDPSSFAIVKAGDFKKAGITQ